MVLVLQGSFAFVQFNMLLESVLDWIVKAGRSLKLTSSNVTIDGFPIPGNKYPDQGC